MKKETKRYDLCYIIEVFQYFPIIVWGVFLHDARLRFNSPLVNLAMDGESFLAFLSDPQRYLDGNFKFLTNTGKLFPVGKNKEITISFVHYKNEEEVIENGEQDLNGLYGTIFM